MQINVKNCFFAVIILLSAASRSIICQKLPPTQPDFSPELFLQIVCAQGKPRIPPTECTCEKQKELCIDLRNQSWTEESNSNETTIPTRYSCNRGMMYMRGISNLVISTVGILGNLLVVAVSLRYYFMITRCNMLIMILAVADLSTSSIRLWRNVPFLWTCHWIYDRVSCVIGNTLLNAASYISMGLIVLIAIERYLGIVHPFHRGISKVQLGFLLFLNGAVGLGIAFPLFLYTDTRDSQCNEVWPSLSYPLVYGIVNLLFFSILPAVAIALIYYRIIQALHESTRKLFRTNATVSFSTETRRIKDNERIMSMVITISFLFVALVFPNRLFLIAKGIMLIKNVKRPVWFLYTDTFFGFIVYSLHAVVNPIIYSLMDRSFRKKVFHLLSCRRVSGNRTDFLRRTSTCVDRTSRRLTRSSHMSTKTTNSPPSNSLSRKKNHNIRNQQLTITSEV